VPKQEAASAGDSEPLINVADYARVARGIPKDVLDYFEGGALDEITLRRIPSDGNE
jgi:hypothetical protein